jgi:hypothetical protein
MIQLQMDAGYHSTEWNETDDQNKPVTSGLYFLQIENRKLFIHWKVSTA